MQGSEPIFLEGTRNIGVLLLHGFTSSPHQFKELAKFLNDRGLTVYAPRIAGHGTKPENLLRTTIEDWRQSVREAYDKLAPNVKEIFVIGDSFGGNLGFDLSLMRSITAIISLGTPIKLRYSLLIKLRIWLYGWARKYYHKPRRYYKLDYTDMTDEVAYAVIPVRSLKNFIKFIEKITRPSLEKITTPALVIHANVDPVVNPNSASYIYEHLGSDYKHVFWFDSVEHFVIGDARREELFKRMYDFIEDILNGALK